MIRKLFALLVCFPPFVAATAMPVFAGTITGWVDYQDRYELSVTIPGIVEAVSVKSGERVLAGTVLLLMESKALQSVLASAEARQALAREEQAEARRSLERDQALYDEGSLSAVELDLARISMLEKQSVLAQSNVAVMLAKSRIEQSKVIAPVAGMVLGINVGPGVRTAPDAIDQPMIVFAGNTLVVRARVASGSVAMPSLNQRLDIVIGDSKTGGIVRVIDPGAEPGFTRLQIEVENLSAGIGEPVTITY